MVLARLAMSHLFERISISSLAWSSGETPLAGMFHSIEDISSTSTTSNPVQKFEICQESGKQTKLDTTNNSSVCLQEWSYPSSWGSTSSSKGCSSESKDCSSQSTEGGENNFADWRKKQSLEALLEERKDEEKRLQQRVKKLMAMLGEDNVVAAFQSDTVLSKRQIYLDKSASTSVVVYHKRYIMSTL